MVETTEHAKHVVDLIREYDSEDVRKFPHAAHYVMGIAARKIERMTAQLEQVTRERDAAVEDLKDELKKHSIISMCEHCMYKPADDYIPNDCMDCVNSCNWQWRGVEVQHGKE